MSVQFGFENRSICEVRSRALKSQKFLTGHSNYVKSIHCFKEIFHVLITTNVAQKHHLLLSHALPYFFSAPFTSPSYCQPVINKCPIGICPLRHQTG